jgi:hypothetical protein
MEEKWFKKISLNTSPGLKIKLINLTLIGCLDIIKRILKKVHLFIQENTLVILLTN